VTADAIKYARWQHPAVGCRKVLPGTILRFSSHAYNK